MPCFSVLLRGVIWCWNVSTDKLCSDSSRLCLCSTIISVETGSWVGGCPRFASDTSGALSIFFLKAFAPSAAYFVGLMKIPVVLFICCKIYMFLLLLALTLFVSLMSSLLAVCLCESPLDTRKTIWLSLPPDFCDRVERTTDACFCWRLSRDKALKSFEERHM